MGDSLLLRRDAAFTRLSPWRRKYPDVEVVESVVAGHPVTVLSGVFGPPGRCLNAADR
ncbi:hypothetical protein ITP53_14985 [Nonomuraea sp. K274]|uniref:Uncharacterized protein n=1 Tax=Nonomuraea cypriaca TaxID=1187855 RepID=A0A931A896_9ACTN|nr:hypothetical protein [Nonomuraea cypriaca]MBF8187018.1 hypothetical protein [Nonomuraea cypriaca]